MQEKLESDFFLLIQKWASEHKIFSTCSAVVASCFVWWIFSLTLGFLFPSGPVLAWVVGTVKADFENLDRHAILFIPESGGQKAWSGIIDKNLFNLSYRGDNRGIFPGEYQVIVIDKSKEDIPKDEDRIGIKVSPSYVTVRQGNNEFEFDLKKTPDPIRYVFECPYEIAKVNGGLKRRYPEISWGLEDGRRPMISGHFPNTDGSFEKKSGVCIKQGPNGIYELEDWASVFSHRGEWPQGLDSQKVLKFIKAKEIKLID